MRTYFISDGTHVKIGKSENPQRRLASLQTAHAKPLYLLMTIVGDHEADYQQVFGCDRLEGEWFAWSASHTELAFFVATGRRRTSNDSLVDVVPS